MLTLSHAPHPERFQGIGEEPSDAERPFLDELPGVPQEDPENIYADDEDGLFGEDDEDYYDDLDADYEDEDDDGEDF